MNRQKFLAELRRLLVYMTEEDREEALRRCAAAFDAAGPDGELDLIDRLGSPTKTAIALSRGYEPGKLPEVFPAHAAKPRPAAPAAEAPAETGDPWSDLPDFDPPPLPEEEPAEASPEAPPVEETRAPAAPAVRVSPAPLPEPEEADEPLPEKTPKAVFERSMPLGLGIPLFLLVFVALGLPLAVLCVVLAVVLAVPGCAVLFGAYLVFIGALWCLSYMADAVLLFGLALVVLALGLLTLWLGVWLAVKLLSAYGQGVGWISGELLGRRVVRNA